MSLEQATAAALAAAQAGDLDAVERALEARARALAAGAVPTPGVAAAGDLTLQLVRELRARLAHLEQFDHTDTGPSIRIVA
jgi:hypothetical protein